MITRLPRKTISMYSVSRPISRSATRCIRHIKSRPINSQSPLLLCSRQQIRLSSTTSPPPATEPRKPIDLRSQLPNAPPPPPSNPSSQLIEPNQPTPKRSLRPYIYALSFLILGLTSGQYVRLVLAPPPLPAAGSHEDDLMIEYLHTQASALPLVVSLSNDPDWTSHHAYSSLTPTERAKRITTGPLAGARGVGGYQRIFHNALTNEYITVIYFGGALAGWPGVTHGGVIATIMDESLGRCAISLFPAKTGVTANLEIDYKRPVVTNAFYVVRIRPLDEQDDAKGDGKWGVSERKAWVGGTLEDLGGHVLGMARALFVVPKGGLKTKVVAGDF